MIHFSDFFVAYDYCMGRNVWDLGPSISLWSARFWTQKAGHGLDPVLMVSSVFLPVDSLRRLATMDALALLSLPENRAFSIKKPFT